MDYLVGRSISAVPGPRKSGSDGWRRSRQEDLGADIRPSASTCLRTGRGSCPWAGGYGDFSTRCMPRQVPNLLLPYIRDKVKGNRGPWLCRCLCSATGILTTGCPNCATCWDGFHTVAGGAFVGALFLQDLGRAGGPAQDMALLHWLTRRQRR